jgi:hypothetical protein
MAKDKQRQKTGARTIDRSSAEISDGTLAVELGERSASDRQEAAERKMAATFRSFAGVAD